MTSENIHQRIESFQKRFGEAHLYLAYHAAFPLSLTPDLMYRIWMNFQRDNKGNSLKNKNGFRLNIPWIAVSDLLLSDFCNEVAHELYEMDQEIRNELLKRMRADERFGRARIKQLSEFLLKYIEDQLNSHDPYIRNFANAQKWITMAYTEPAKIARNLAEALSSRVKEDDKGGIIRTASLIETVAEPLSDAGIVHLLAYSRVMKEYVKDNIRDAIIQIEKLKLIKPHIQISSIELPIPTKFLETIQQQNKKIAEHQPEIEGLSLRSDMLTFDSPKKIIESPKLLIQIFEESSKKKLPLSDEARLLINDFSYLIDKSFRTDPDVIRIFEQILSESDPELNILNEMLNTNFLTRFIPEFEKIRNRIQYDEYHVDPVDIHSLKTVKILRRFSYDHTQDPLCYKLYQELLDKHLLLWAALLHDIGKDETIHGHSKKGAKIAREILAEKNYSEKQVETVSFLIQEHLLLIKTATRRDIQDEETAVFCARKIGDAECLKMLYLLTVADSLCTGPKAWNNWTASLLRRFFLSVLNVLERGELANLEAISIIEHKKAGVMKECTDAESVKKLLNSMPLRYLLYTSETDIGDHIRLYQHLGDSPFVWEVRKHDDTRQVTFCAKDTPGLISKIVGIFSLNDINILDVQVHTWLNRMALDIFEVSPPPDLLLEDERWERARRDMEAALSGSLNLTEALKEKFTHPPYMPRTVLRPHRIKIDNDSSSFFTIIEVFTYDFPGLLFKVSDALFRCELDIWLAKIATKNDQVVDVFYVRDFGGQKVESQDLLETIEAAVLDVLLKE